MLKKHLIGAACLTLAALSLPPTQPVHAADHIDSPRVREAASAAVDITDLFARIGSVRGGPC